MNFRQQQPISPSERLTAQKAMSLEYSLKQSLASTMMIPQRSTNMLTPGLQKKYSSIVAYKAAKSVYLTVPPKKAMPSPSPRKKKGPKKMDGGQVEGQRKYDDEGELAAETMNGLSMEEILRRAEEDGLKEEEKALARARRLEERQEAERKDAEAKEKERMIRELERKEREKQDAIKRKEEEAKKAALLEQQLLAKQADIEARMLAERQASAETARLRQKAQDEEDEGRSRYEHDPLEKAFVMQSLVNGVEQVQFADAASDEIVSSLHSETTDLKLVLQNSNLIFFVKNCNIAPSLTYTDIFVYEIPSQPWRLTLLLFAGAPMDEEETSDAKPLPKGINRPTADLHERLHFSSYYSAPPLIIHLPMAHLERALVPEHAMWLISEFRTPLIHSMLGVLSYYPYTYNTNIPVAVINLSLLKYLLDKQSALPFRVDGEVLCSPTVPHGVVVVEYNKVGLKEAPTALNYNSVLANLSPYPQNMPCCLSFEHPSFGWLRICATPAGKIFLVKARNVEKRIAHSYLPHHMSSLSCSISLSLQKDLQTLLKSNELSVQEAFFRDWQVVGAPNPFLTSAVADATTSASIENLETYCNSKTAPEGKNEVSNGPKNTPGLIDTSFFTGAEVDGAHLVEACGYRLRMNLIDRETFAQQEAEFPLNCTFYASGLGGRRVGITTSFGHHLVSKDNGTLFELSDMFESEAKALHAEATAELMAKMKAEQERTTGPLSLSKSIRAEEKRAKEEELRKQADIAQYGEEVMAIVRKREEAIQAGGDDQKQAGAKVVQEYISPCPEYAWFVDSDDFGLLHVGKEKEEGVKLFSSSYTFMLVSNGSTRVQAMMGKN